MIILQVSGGLGNQMQEYAMYRKLLSLGKKVKLDLAWFDERIQQKLFAPREFELGYFTGLPYEVCTEEERDALLRRGALQRAAEKLFPERNPVFRESEMYHPEIFSFTDKYVIGYFLCQQYYDDILPELRELFQFPMHTNPLYHLRNTNLMNEMEERPSVSVHIRRGDYISNEKNRVLFDHIATDAYYAAAMEYFRMKDPATHFYLFSDDPAYLRERYDDPDRYTVVDWNTGKNSLLDLQLMSHCRGNICANSTFSFWGARLNRRRDHEAVRTLSMRSNQPVTPQQMHIYWKGWLLVDAAGKFV